MKTTNNPINYRLSNPKKFDRIYSELTFSFYKNANIYGEQKRKATNQQDFKTTSGKRKQRVSKEIEI